MQSNNQGTFIISIDFELYWGMKDKVPLEKYEGNIIGVRLSIPMILELFSTYGIHATWGVVGELFSSDNSIFGSAPMLIKQIAELPNQEIGSHTFSHIRCLEKTIKEFEEDLKKAKKVHSFKSLIFPWNQFTKKHLSVLKKLGITAYRGNPSGRMYNGESFFKRALRYADAYFNLSGHNTFIIKKEKLTNIPASRFMYWYNKKLRFIEGFRLRRIKKDMTYAAKKGLNYHLWFHPHNFGIGENRNKNLQFLEKICEHYFYLNLNYGMQSKTMQEAIQ